MKPAQIKAIRKDLGLTQMEFATAMGVSFATVSRWEKGHTVPHPERVQKMQQLTKTEANAEVKVQHEFSEQVNYWTGRLTIAIGAGQFRDEVSRMLNTVINETYERAQRWKK